MRLADVEPADGTPVSCGANTTRSTPSSVRAICVSTVSRPCPHSTAAVWISATGPPGSSESVSRTAAASSNPSLYATFL